MATRPISRCEPAFSVTDVATWPVVMGPEHIAAIYGRTVLALKKACQDHRFLPAPYKTKPYRWRRTDVERDALGPRMVPRLQRTGT